ncbi:hypothetical protein [Methanolobus sp. ZRKC5]|uniref:hypothetical protein n=1 Tax=unclassified Methanolobus TaxID=2629569 RepID=UPI00313D9CBB
MMRKITITFALMMILFSTSIPGVYAMQDEESMGMPEINAEQMKEMNMEMIDSNIDSLTSLQSESDDEELLDSVASLLEQMESLKTELETTDDQAAIVEIMNELRSSIEEAPEELRETLMQNNPMEREGQVAMDGERPERDTANTESFEGDFPGNGSMGEEKTIDKTDNGNAPTDEVSNEGVSKESTGLLSSLINMIKGFF